MSPNEVLELPALPRAAHELAAILQFGTSFELVEWLAHRLQYVSDMLAQEDKDRIMIQKAMIGAIEPEEQPELDRNGRQRTAKYRGEAIQMPPWNTALVEVHPEYVRMNKVARDMAKA